MIAHGLTALRFGLIVPTALGFASPDRIAPELLVGFIAVAIATDYLDGAAARRAGTASAGGQLFDHTTDFLFVTAGLAGAAWAGVVTPLLPPLIAVAFAQYVLDSRLLHRAKRLRMSALGRWNGLMYFVPLVMLALGRLDALGPVSHPLQEAAGWLAWGLVATTLLSIADRALAPLRSGRFETRP